MVQSRGFMFVVLACLSLPHTLVFAATEEPRQLLLQERTDHLDRLAREPMLVEHPSGAIFVAGYPSQVSGRDWTVSPRLWRSDTAGKQWRSVKVGRSVDGAQGNSDVDLSVGPGGRLFYASMGFDRGSGEGTQIAVGVSEDVGKSWKWQFLSRQRLDDRPWIRVSDEGVVHLVWNNIEGVNYARSLDHGLSWSKTRQIAKRGGSSHLAVGPDGRVAVRVSPIWASANRFDATVDFILVSQDAGESWARHSLPNNIAWDPSLSDPNVTPRWVEPIAWTGDGVLHHIWGEEAAIHYAYSNDAGASWATQSLAFNDGRAFYPYLSSKGDDRLALSWFSKDGATLKAHVAVAERGANWSRLQLYRAAPLELDAWDEKPGPKVPNTGGEYVPVVILANGDVALATPIQDLEGDRWGFSYWRFSLQGGLKNEL